MARTALRRRALRRPSLVVPVRLLWAVLVAMACARAAYADPLASPVPSGGLHVHVRGAVEIQATASSEGGELTLRGEIVDDTGTPLGTVPLLVRALGGDGHASSDPLGGFAACEAGQGHGGRSGRVGEEALLETDERGAFCGTSHAPANAASLRLRFRGSKLYDGVELSVPIEMNADSRRRTTVRFESPPEVIDLDRDSAAITATLKVDRLDGRRQVGGAGALLQRANLPLGLFDERGKLVSQASAGGDHRVRFEFKTADLDGPGPGELSARFAGTQELGPASASQRIVRRAEVRLRLSRPVPVVDPSGGIPIEVDLETVRGPVEGGVVEVRRVIGANLESVGAANVDIHGHARVVAAFGAAGVSRATLELAYVPSAEAYRSGRPLRVDVILGAPSVLPQVVVGAVVIAAAAWVASGFRRAPRSRLSREVEGAPTRPAGRASIRVVSTGADMVGWRGTVADAHDGTPVAAARLTIIAPTFEGDGVVAEATSDDAGAFALEGAWRSDGRLVVEAPAYSQYEQQLPPASVLSIALVTRRRAVLERIVRWARHRGAPFDKSPEPTPGHVRRAARRADAEEIEAWAERVEVAIFGPAELSAADEHELKSREPGRSEGFGGRSRESGRPNPVRSRS